MTVTEDGGRVHWAGRIPAERDPDVWTWLDCDCRDDGPWYVYGPLLNAYSCALCGALMDLYPL